MSVKSIKHGAAVIGDGAMGTAMAGLLVGRGLRVTLWSPFAEYAEELSRTRRNPKFLPGVDLPAALTVTAEGADLPPADLVILAVPTQFLRGVLERLKPHLPADALYVSVAKGLEVGSLLRPSEIVAAVLGDRPFAALSGPSHAEEVAVNLPASVVAAAADESLARAVQETCRTSRFRVYTSVDVIGVELGGALKNIIAIAAGICDGLSLGDNAKAALMTRGIVEIARLGVALGADAATFNGLSGIGDLIVTCASRHSRNRAVGEAIGRGEPLDHVLARMVQVAEGVWTTRAARDLARRAAVDLPITDAVYACLFDHKPPLDALTDLMLRPPRPETRT
jgi:glycerol-3-phosphate dehydrogenase (NAD(P)+)